MWQGKKKAVTFSFDDGVTQDIRMIEILNKYGLKCTFNLNSSLLGLKGSLDRNGRTVSHVKVEPKQVKDVYQGHEVAVHSLTHPHLPSLPDEAVVWQVEQDRKTLSELCGYEVVGMAYPGCNNNDDRVAELIKKHTGVRYARTIDDTGSFNLQSNYYRFHPTVYYIDENFEKIVDEFLALETDEPKLLYIWGHSYEMDAEYRSWEKFERICAKMSRKEDIFYGTNKEVLLGE